MTYAVVYDVPASWDHYSVVAAALDGEAPEGLVLHAAGPTDEGFRMIDVWESESAWLRFRADRLEALSEGLLHPPIARALEVAHVVVGAPHRISGLDTGSSDPLGHHDRWRSP